MYFPIAILALATCALAQPSSAPWSGWKHSKSGGGGTPPPSQHSCLNATGIETLVAGYTYLLEYPGGADFNATANAILTDSGFVVDSDSILTLSGRAVSSPRPPSRPDLAHTRYSVSSTT